jgi:hypothetical protein
MPENFHYSAQLRNWILQVIRVFSGLQVQYNVDASGNQLYMTVPIIWGDGSMQAATIQRLNSENMMPTIPMMSIYINNLKYDRSRSQDPTYVDSKNLRTRQYDPISNTFLPLQGNAYTIKRPMPAPYKMEMRLDIVTSNTQQKMQILEQILPLFNPAMEIQKSDNFLAWDSLSYLELTDTIWSSRTIPVGQGTDTTYDITTLQFESPIWMTLSASVSKMNVIFKVITDIIELSDCNDLMFGTRSVVTFNNYGIFVQNGIIKILKQGLTSPNIVGVYGQPQDWGAILSSYGNLRPGVSQISLSYADNANEVIGTITIDPSDSTNMLYNIDETSLPINTIPPITGIVNPMEVAPGFGLPFPTSGQSYLLTGNIGSQFPYDNYANVNLIIESGSDLETETDIDLISEWPLYVGTASANINDIITYNSNSNAWITTFSANNNVGNIQFVEDIGNGVQYQWNGNTWIQAVDGPYTAANWSLII